jgi:hypothetical protein
MEQKWVLTVNHPPLDGQCEILEADNALQDLAGSAYAIQPVCFVWATQILVRQNDDAARAVILYSMNGTRIFTTMSHMHLAC